MSNLKLVRLSNGDDIIGFLESYSDQEINNNNSENEDIEQPQYTYDNILFIRDPMRMNWAYNVQTKGHELFLTRWMPFSDDSLYAIPKDKVITVSDPIHEVEKHYFELSENPESEDAENPQTVEDVAEQQKKIFTDFLKSWEIDKDKDKEH